MDSTVAIKKRVLNVVQGIQGVCDRPHLTPPPTTITRFPSEGHEGHHASEHSGDSGSVSSIDQPKAGDSGTLSERYVMRSTGIHK